MEPSGQTLLDVIEIKSLDPEGGAAKLIYGSRDPVPAPTMPAMPPVLPIPAPAGGPPPAAPKPPVKKGSQPSKPASPR